MVAPMVALAEDVERVARSLLQLTCTEDQTAALTAALQRMSVSEPGSLCSPIALTGRRGRGKSTVAGLVVAGVLGLSLPSAAMDARAVVITAPSMDNLKTLRLAVERGLQKLQLVPTKSRDTDDGGSVVHVLHYSEDATVSALPVHFITPEKADVLVRALSQLGGLIVLVVDEAASLPIPRVRSLLACPSVVPLLSSTLSGCEGTGSALAFKVFEPLLDGKQERRVGISAPLFLHLEEPVRYGLACPVERMLDRLVMTASTDAEQTDHLDMDVVGSAEEARLFAVRTEVLQQQTDSVFAQLLVSLLQTHYRTSASDIANMLAQAYMRLFVLLPGGSDTPLPLVALLCITEQPADLKTENKSNATRVSRALLTTFGIEQDFPEISMQASCGLRVTRVVCDPRLRSRGFGSAAVNQLAQQLERQQQPASTQVVNDVGDSSHLLKDLPTCDLPKADWLSASFGITRPLLQFWSRLGFIPAVLSPTQNPQTGEVSVIMIKPLQNAPAVLRSQLSSTGPNFAVRHLRLLPQMASFFGTSLSVELLAAAGNACCGTLADVGPWHPSDTDAARLERLAISRNPLPNIAHCQDLLPVLAEVYFTQRVSGLKLTREDEELLLSVGAKRLPIADAAADIGLPNANLAALGVRRIAGEICRKVGFCILKEVLMVATPCQGSNERSGRLWSWLPPASDVHGAMMLPLQGSSEEGQSRGELRLPLQRTISPQLASTDEHESRFLCGSCSWTYSSGSDSGVIQIEVPTIEGPGGLAVSAGSWRLQALVLHSLQSKFVAIGEHLAASVQLVFTLGSPFGLAQLEAALWLQHTCSTSYGAPHQKFCGFVRLPSLEDLASAGVPSQLMLPVFEPPSCRRNPSGQPLSFLSCTATWTLPAATGPQMAGKASLRGRATLTLDGIRLGRLDQANEQLVADQSVACHAHIYGVVSKVAGSANSCSGGGGAEAAPPMRIVLRPKQNRP
eukprot:TRINITY_DN50400_c0_g1_i1.p1 TRINITY_DN50400_c0_g1~~TRINITY_DN50400_c0_g1_i1.p1  ORF type:complete len:966 (-),score=122.79 TRINITY_DN50400_c0_g1_i1:620-3517(-)